MRSVSTAFEVLDAVAERQPVGVGELARLLDLPKSTVQRCLAVLADSGWIRAWDSPGHTRWVLTVKPLTLAGHVLRDQRLLREAAAPAMADLGRSTRETIHLTIPDGDGVVLLDKIDSTHTVRNVSWIGGRAPIHASASGLAMLAHLLPQQLETLVLTRYTDATPIAADVLADMLAEIRTRGYAVNTGMWRDDVSAVAAAILDPTRAPVAALSISLPTYRLTDDLRTRFGEQIRAAAIQTTRARYGTPDGTNLPLPQPPTATSS